MQKEQFSGFEKLEAVVQHVHVEIRTEHTKSLIEKWSYNKFINAGMDQHIQCMFGRATLALYQTGDSEAK